MTTHDTADPAGERADLLDALRTHRYLLLHTVDGLTDEQAALRTTVSELTLGGLVKHVAATESQWCDFIEHGPSAMEGDGEDAQERAAGFRMGPDDTLDALVEHFHQVADRTDALVESLPDLGTGHPLPPAPWFEPGATRSARRVFVHLVAEIAQHAGHADILRESIDGQKTMG
ncbi:MAG TPA: DinB family protein [Ornithinibacter sp.]|nr:DinB family protein [Ornithinibacter sp.]